MYSNILITDTNGFIGKNLTQKLRLHNKNIFIINHDTVENEIPESLIEKIEELGLRIAILFTSRVHAVNSCNLDKKYETTLGEVADILTEFHQNTNVDS